MTNSTLDFDKWKKLAKTDPEAFEKMRLTEIEKVISQRPRKKQQRLRQLQWKIDMERKRCKTPMAACIKISQMMWDKQMEHHNILNNFIQKTVFAPPFTKKPSATVLPFKKT